MRDAAKIKSAYRSLANVCFFSVCFHLTNIGLNQKSVIYTQNRMSEAEHEAHKKLEREMLAIQDAHSKELAGLEMTILKAKKEIHHKNHDIRKTKAQVTRYQTLLRKNGITDVEVR